MATPLPAVREMLAGEVWALACDFSRHLEDAETLSLPTGRLIDLETNRDYDDGLVDSAHLVSNEVVQTVGNLQSGHKYLLVWHATITAGKKPSETLTIVCPRLP